MNRLMSDRPHQPPKRRFGPSPARGPNRRERPAGRPFGEWPDDVAILYGWHSVSEALRNPRRRVRKLMATENALKRLVDENIPLPFEPQLVRPGEIDRLLEPDAVHQGLFAECDPLPSPNLDEAAENDLILVLDQIPTTTKFDKEVREQLLDSFRDAADYWAERKISFRCFYSFL